MKMTEADRTVIVLTIENIIHPMITVLFVPIQVPIIVRVVSIVIIMTLRDQRYIAHIISNTFILTKAVQGIRPKAVEDVS